jgi:hypothetical protein
MIRRKCNVERGKEKRTGGNRVAEGGVLSDQVGQGKFSFLCHDYIHSTHENMAKSSTQKRKKQPPSVEGTSDIAAGTSLQLGTEGVREAKKLSEWISVLSTIQLHLHPYIDIVNRERPCR